MKLTNVQYHSKSNTVVKLSTMPPHRCCTSCTRESPSSTGITLHHQSCKKYKTHIATVFRLKNQSVAQARANDIDSTRGLTHTPHSQHQHDEPESHMQIDNEVSLHNFTGRSERSDPHLNSCIHLALTLRKDLYHLRLHPLHPTHYLFRIPYPH